MSSMSLFILIVCVIALLFLLINFLFAPHSPYQEKNSIFECGFDNFEGQNRSEFNVIYFLYGLAFMVLDIEVFTMFPFGVSAYYIGTYGLGVVLVFTIIVTLGFVFELAKGALKIDSRQNIKGNNINSINVSNFGSYPNTNSVILQSSFFNISSFKKSIFKYLTLPKVINLLLITGGTCLLRYKYGDDIIQFLVDLNLIENTEDNLKKIKTFVNFLFVFITGILKLGFEGVFDLCNESGYVYKSNLPDPVNSINYTNAGTPGGQGSCSSSTQSAPGSKGNSSGGTQGASSNTSAPSSDISKDSEAQKSNLKRRADEEVSDGPKKKKLKHIRPTDEDIANTPFLKKKPWKDRSFVPKDELFDYLNRDKCKEKTLSQLGFKGYRNVHSGNLVEGNPGNDFSYTLGKLHLVNDNLFGKGSPGSTRNNPTLRRIIEDAYDRLNKK